MEREQLIEEAIDLVQELNDTNLEVELLRIKSLLKGQRKEV